MKKIELPILRVLVILCIPVTIAIAALAPWMLARYGFEREYIAPLWLIALAFLWAVWQLRGILERLHAGDLFSRDNVRYLRRISWCCFAVTLAACWMMLVYFTWIKVLLALLAFAGGMVMRVLAEVFLQAARQKEEMDLII